MSLTFELIRLPYNCLIGQFLLVRSIAHVRWYVLFYCFNVLKEVWVIVSCRCLLPGYTLSVILSLINEYLKLSQINLHYRYQ